MSRICASPGSSVDIHQHGLISSLHPAISPRRVVSPVSRAGLRRHNRRLEIRNARIRATPLFREIPVATGTSSQTAIPGSGVLEDLCNLTLGLPSRPCPTEHEGYQSAPWVLEARTRTSSSSSETMKIRDGTLRPRTPIARQTKAHTNRNVNRSPSWEAAKYIEYLEGQLTSAQTELRALTVSPSSPHSQSHKIRSLSVETQKLRREVAEWERRFDERVEDDGQQRFEIESGLRTRIRHLEQDLDIKETAMKDLQWEMDHAERKSRDSRVLEAENIALGRRIDVLTELLAVSPTKQNFDLGSPTIPERRPSKRGRPTTTAPQIVSPIRDSFPRRMQSLATPGAMKRHSIQGTATDHIHASTRTLSFPIFVTGGMDETNTIAVDSLPQQTENESACSPISFSSPLDHTQARSPPSSSASDMSSVWDSPMPPPSETHRPLQQKRSMRRFRSGSGGPKALILPATSGLGLNPAVLTDRTSSVSPERPEVSEETTPRASRNSMSILRASSKPETSLSTSSPCLGQAPRVVEPTEPPRGDWRWCVDFQSTLPRGTTEEIPCRLDVDEESHGAMSVQSAAPISRTLFSELSLATGVENYSDDQTSFASESPVLSKAVHRTDRLASRLPLSTEASWFGLKRNRMPPSTAVTFALLLAASRAITSEIYASPIRTLWKALTTGWLLNHTSKVLAGLYWCVLGLVLGPTLLGNTNRMRHLTNENRRRKSDDATAKDRFTIEPTLSPRSSVSQEFLGRQATFNSQISMALRCSSAASQSTTVVSDPDQDRSRQFEVSTTRAALWMWLRVLVAMALAFGVAITEGPQALFTDRDEEVDGHMMSMQGLESKSRTELSTTADF